MNQLKGTIDYTLTLEENNVWKLNYNQTIDNDIASIAITQHVLGILEERLRLDKQSAKGKEVGFFTQRISRFPVTAERKQGVHCSYRRTHMIRDTEDVKKKFRSRSSRSRIG